MSGRHQPEEGADSPRGLADMNGGGMDPPMVELPPAEREVVTAHVRSILGPTASDQDVATWASEVMMADTLGRAIHNLRGEGQPLDMPRCVRINRDNQIEAIPYGYDDERPDGYACSCEQVALALVENMKAQTMAREHHGQVIHTRPKGWMPKTRRN